MKGNIYLIAHTAHARSSDIAQASIQAVSEAVARNIFKRRYPERTIQVVGIKGVRG